MLGNFSCFCCRLLIFFFKINFLNKNLSGTQSEYETVWIQIRTNVAVVKFRFNIAFNDFSVISQQSDIKIWASAWDFQQCDILTSVDSDEPVQPPFRHRNSKWCSVSSLTVIEYSSDKRRLWSDCAYAQANLRLCWSHISHCWKSHALAIIL